PLGIRQAGVDPEAVTLRFGTLRDRLEEVSDVRPDPEVLQLAGVDSDRRAPVVHLSTPRAARASAAAVRSAALSQVNSAARSGPPARTRSGRDLLRAQSRSQATTRVSMFFRGSSVPR